MLNCWNIPVSSCLWSALLNFVKLTVIKAYTVKKKSYSNMYITANKVGQFSKLMGPMKGQKKQSASTSR